LVDRRESSHVDEASESPWLCGKLSCISRATTEES
jgi:hypothetical protein